MAILLIWPIFFMVPPPAIQYIQYRMLLPKNSEETDKLSPGHQITFSQQAIKCTGIGWTAQNCQKMIFSRRISRVQLVMSYGAFSRGSPGTRDESFDVQTGRRTL